MKPLFVIVLLFFSLSVVSQTLIGNPIYGENAADYFGENLAISADGKTFISGSTYNNNNATANGSAIVYKNIANNWVQVGAKFYGTHLLEGLGKNVSISADGSIIAISATQTNDGSSDGRGVVYIYKFIANNWVLLGQPILGENAGNQCGYSIDLSSDGMTIAVTSPTGVLGSGNIVYPGKLRIFHFDGNNWIQKGQDIVGTMTDDGLGAEVSISSNGNKVAVGSLHHNGAGDIGFVKVYEYINNVWTQLGQTLYSDVADDFYGTSLALSGNGNTLVVGAYLADVNGTNSGFVKVYDFVSNNWTQIGQTFEGTTYMAFGARVSITNDGNVFSFGTAEYDYHRGILKIYRRNFNSWTQFGTDILGDYTYDNLYANRISADGTTIVTGAPGNDSTGVNSGQVKVFDLTPLLNLDQLAVDNFSIYPNPTSEAISIEFSNDGELQKVNFYNTVGQLVKTSNSSKISVADLSKGTYFVEVLTSQGKATKKLIVN